MIERLREIPKKYLILIFIVIAVIAAGCITYMYWPKQTSKDTSATVKTAADTATNTANPESASNDTKDTLSDETAEEKWDGDSVGIDTTYNTDIDTGLPDEVKAQIGGDTKTMVQYMEMYLSSEYDISNVTKIEWDGMETIDYQNNQILLTFYVSADTSCTVQTMYNQKNDAWGFQKL